MLEGFRRHASTVQCSEFLRTDRGRDPQKLRIPCCGCPGVLRRIFEVTAKKNSSARRHCFRVRQLARVFTVECLRPVNGGTRHTDESVPDGVAAEPRW